MGNKVKGMGNKVKGMENEVTGWAKNFAQTYWHWNGTFLSSDKMKFGSYPTTSSTTQ